MQNFIIMITLYNPSTWCIDSSMIHFKKKPTWMNIAISGQKLKITFIQSGGRDALKVSVLADYYKQIFNERLQPQGK